MDKPEIKFSHEIPPIYYECKKRFNISWDRGVVITYDGTVYSKNELPPDLIVHEAVHIIQQKEVGVEKWWNLYFNDVKFRLAQEVGAYLVQAKFIRENITNKGKKRAMLKHLYKSMSSMYGNMCTEEQAKKILGI